MTTRRFLQLLALAALVVLGLQYTAVGQGIARNLVWLADKAGNGLTSSSPAGSARGLDVYIKNPADGSSVTYTSEDHNTGASTANTLRTVAADDATLTNYHTSAGTSNDETQIKSGSGRVYAIFATNTNAAPRYLRCHDQTSAGNTPGTTAITIGGAIPGDASGRGFVFMAGPTGVPFTTGFTCDLATGAADTNTTNVAADEIKWTIVYK